MRINYLRTMLKTGVRAATVLLFGAGVAGAQQVNLTAAATNAALPDGTTVPMWGYSCNGATGTGVACNALNPIAGANWSPVVITVQSGSDLNIMLTNNLPAPVPTSLVIVGQFGGGLGTPGGFTTPPDHSGAQAVTWPIADPTTTGTPPQQLPRVQSFGTEVTNGKSATLTWTKPRPGTYLLEPGTHPSIQATMGLVGMVVVTTSPTTGTGTAYASSGTGSPVTYNAELPVLFSEIDPVQNSAVAKAVSTSGFSESSTYGPYFGGPVASISITNAGQNYTSSPTVTFAGGSGSGASATAVVDTTAGSPTLGQVTEIDIVSGGNYSAAPSVMLTGGGGSGAAATPTLQLNSALSQCGGGAAACYPPVVNYSPRYYLINGVAFDKTHVSNSLIPVSPQPITSGSGSVLVRMVNAGSRMHVPAIVGSTTGGTGGLSLIAEDGNALPGTPRVQSEIFMAAGKTYDAMIDAPASASYALPIFDRELSLSGNATARDAGMLAYLDVTGKGIATPLASASAKANPDEYDAIVAGQTLTISDPSKGVIGNDVNIYGVTVKAPPTKGTLSLNADGTFQYAANADWSGGDSFTYCGNGVAIASPLPAACTTVTLNASTLATSDAISCSAATFHANTATYLATNTPGVLASCTDVANLPLTVDTGTIKPNGQLSIVGDTNGGFKAAAPGAGTYSFTFQAQNSLGMHSTATTMTVVFPPGSGLSVTVLDGADKQTTIADYRWIIEEDRTFFVDPACVQNPQSAGCPAKPVNFGTNFHTSYMPVIASGCTGDTSCGANQTLQGQGVAQQPVASPSDVALCKDVPAGTPCLDPNKRYYISVLPGDAAQPFIAGYAGAPDCSVAGVAAGSCGHGMGGAPIAKGAHDSSQSVLILTEPSPYPPATLTVFVFEDDNPLNGEHDAGGGVDTLSPEEPGLGGFQITLADDAGGTGDATGNPTYDMFNMPLSNSLAGTIDPVTRFDACPIAAQASTPIFDKTGKLTGNSASVQAGIAGMIVTCPTYESDGKTLSPLAGQAVIKNLYQGRYGVIANPGADRLARGEEWLQTNTLDGQKAHDSFMRIGEPGYFQEFGPAGYHVTIGFANPKIINDRGKAMCAPTGADCSHEVKGHITTARMSRTPDERLYGSGTHDSYAFTQCYVSLGDPDGADIEFTKCDADGNFDFPSVPAGNWKITTFDQWNDQVVDGITTAVGMCTPGATPSASTCLGTDGKGNVDMGEVAVHQWQANIYTRTFLDMNGDGISNVDSQGNPSEPGLPLVATNIRFRDGSFSNFNNTDLNGFAGFNEVFPLFNWYVIETDTTRYKNTGTHVVYDSGGPVDGSSPNGVACASASISDLTAPKTCGDSNIAQNLANTYEPNPLPADLSVPGAVYCSDADCSGASIAKGPVPSSSTNHSTGRIDPPWVNTYGWQGFSGQNNFLEFGKKPFADGENGGIHGHVVYASTRPFDDPQLLLQLSWEPQIPHVTINLYKEGFAGDGVTPTLTLVDQTQTSSFDDWAQGFRSDGKPNMNCPGQGTDSSLMKDSLFWLALKDQPQYLDFLSGNGSPAHTLPYDSQFKCYDGMHNWNQLQPAPYDGMYSFPSVTATDPATGKPMGTNCTACTTNPDATDPARYGLPMLPDGKYVVEVVVPPNFELVKEEDKNILIGDNYIAPVTQQFGGLGSIYILPDQASIASYNGYNPQNPTTSEGRNPSLPSHEGDTGSIETFWPCVGEQRIVPDYISLFPGSQEVSPFAGAKRPLCDRKEITLTDQTSALAKFYLFTPTHTASHFTGVITDDFTAEFDPFSPQFGEKFAPAYLPVSFKDWSGNEISRVYSDAWGAYNGLNYSTWEVNPPNPTGYGPTMMVGCMNDAGPVKDSTGQPAIDPLFQSGYSQFCYELPFMPGQTGYFDTPVVPTSAFAGGYNPADCAYPDSTPAVSEVDGDGVGPWIAGLKGTVTSIALTNGGTGYTTAPSVTINNTGTGGTGAAATAVISGSVTAVNLTAATATLNRGYSTAPVVGFTGGGGSGTAATANLTGSVTSVTLTNRGSGYTSNPTVTFAGGGGSGATGTTSLRVSSVTITSGGAGYTTTGTTTNRVSVSFAAPPAGGTRATGTAVLGTGGVITRVNVNNQGNGYTSVPTITFSGTHTTAASATAVMQLSAVTITNAGSGYTGQATVSFSSGAAAGTVIMGHSVASVTVTDGGTGFTSAPGVTFTGNVQTGGLAAAATSTFASSVVAVNVTNPGSGYNTAPTVTLTGGGGSGALATAFIEVNGSITISALPDQNVDNYGYSGPFATAPYNQMRIKRHYGFGSAPTDFSNFPALTAPATYSCNSSTATAVCPFVTVGGQALTAVAWSDTSITGTVPGTVPACTLQQQALYGGSKALCGQLSITAVSGAHSFQSIDSVTVTVGGKAPTHVNASGTIQAAIDKAKPGDLIIVDPTCTATVATTGVTVGQAVSCSSTANLPKQASGTHQEMVLMWKPIRLQGVGAPSSIIDANPHPAGKLDPWRRQVVCLFGLGMNGIPISTANTYDPSNTFTCTPDMQFSVDRLPLEATVGWDATLNGNLAEQLIEPTLMGAYEGAGITVLGKGVKFPNNSNPFASDVFPTGTLLLTSSDCLVSGNNKYPSNFLCNPSSIDGLTIKNSSQGGGGILVHGWGHNLQIANNRVLNNQGTLSGGITVGQGEHPDVYLVGSITNTVPGSCITNTGSASTNMALPYCFDLDVNVHNNAVTQNSSLGDELFSSTPAGAGGVTMCNGSDYYKFNYNWVCGNMSTGDGAGVAHVGFSYDGDIEHNTILFNQSTNPTIVTNGGGLLIMGAPDIDPPCGDVIDIDCVSAPGTISPSDGIGPGLIVNANLLVGNSADSGSGGGLRLQHVNGTEVLNFPDGRQRTLLGFPVAVPWPVVPNHPAHPSFQTTTFWNSVNVTNNIIANNVAGWDGGGISLQDALAVNLINNTLVANYSTASSGVLFQTLFAPLASTQGVNCFSGSQSCAQPAGLVSVDNSAVLTANINQLAGGLASVHCPANHGTVGGASDCTKFSIPELYNDMFWQNRSLFIKVGGLSTGLTNQQNMVSVYDAVFGGTAVAATGQGHTGACDDPNAASSYWDIGVRGDTRPGGTHPAGGTLSPFFSVLTNTTGTYGENGTGTNNLLAPASTVNSAYCNGARVPVESGGSGWEVPPGTNESNALPAPPFTLLAGATVDEGNNWINLRWGPLSLNMSTFTFDPSPVPGSPGINYIASGSAQYTAAPSLDFYGNPRKTGSDPKVDVGAVEYQAPPVAVLTVTPTSLSFGFQAVNVASTSKTLTLTNSGTAAASISAVAFTGPFSRPSGAAGGTCGASLGVNGSCTISVVFTPTAAGPVTGTATITANVPVTNSPVSLSGTGQGTGALAFVTPTSLAFGNWATGTTSTVLSVTVTNVGSTALAGGTFTAGAPFSRVTSGTGNCGATLAVQASCTIRVQFAPAAATPYTGNLTVAYTGATVTGSSVALTGTGVAARATVSITPNPLTITLPSGTISGNGTVTFANTAASGGAQVTVTNVSVSGGSILTYFFTVGTNNCTGTVIPPGRSCTVSVGFTNVLSSRGTNRTGTITFTDSGSGTPQASGLVGFATP